MTDNQSLGGVKSITAEKVRDKWKVHFVEAAIGATSKGKIVLKSTHDPIIVDMIHFERICGDVNVVQHGGSIGAEELGDETRCLVFNLGDVPDKESHLYCTGDHGFFEKVRRRYRIPRHGEAYFEEEEPPLVVVERVVR